MGIAVHWRILCGNNLGRGHPRTPSSLEPARLGSFY
jgi:hypothetical protein